MPQVNGRTIRERARRLRQAGEHQVTAYLAARTGETHNILMESPRMGRTETFAPVRFGSDQTVGQIVRAVIAGHDSDALCA